MNNENEEEIKNLFKEKNKELYDYLFIAISYYNKSKEKPDKIKKIKDKKKEYYNKHKEEICEKQRLEYQKNKEEKILKVKAYQLKKKQELLNKEENTE